MEELRTTSKLVDETGNRYGKLVVIERVGTKIYPSGQKKPIWSCLCDCGTVIEVPAQSLRAGQYQSCGCGRKDLKTDWTGVKQGKLTVVSRAEGIKERGGRTTVRWLCECECGGSIILKSSALKNGSTSCGCAYKRREKHGHTVKAEPSPTFTSWHAMMQRCLNPNHQAYQLYGAIGITVCERWRDFSNFLEDMGERPEGTTLNRINGAEIYSLETCEWATYSLQAYDQKKRSTNKSGVTGVCWDKRMNKWEAYISVDKKKVSLGFFDDVPSAAEARRCAELKYYGFTKQQGVYERN